MKRTNKYQKMIAELSKIDGYDATTQSVDILTMHRVGRLVWKLHWKITISNKRIHTKDPNIWKFRVELTPEMRVNKKSAKIDFSKIPEELHDTTKQSLLIAQNTGPFFKGMSAFNMDEFKNGKSFLWEQVVNWQAFFSTIRKLEKEKFYETVDSAFPHAFRVLIEKQK